MVLAGEDVSIIPRKVQSQISLKWTRKTLILDGIYRQKSHILLPCKVKTSEKTIDNLFLRVYTHTHAHTPYIHTSYTHTPHMYTHHTYAHTFGLTLWEYRTSSRKEPHLVKILGDWDFLVSHWQCFSFWGRQNERFKSPLKTLYFVWERVRGAVVGRQRKKKEDNRFFFQKITPIDLLPTTEYPKA